MKRLIIWKIPMERLSTLLKFSDWNSIHLNGFWWVKFWTKISKLNSEQKSPKYQRQSFKYLVWATSTLILQHCQELNSVERVYLNGDSKFDVVQHHNLLILHLIESSAPWLHNWIVSRYFIAICCVFVISMGAHK